MRIVISNVQPLPESVQTDLGQMLALAMYCVKMDMTDVRVEFEYETTDSANVHD